MRRCGQCHQPYSPERTRSGDFPLTFCSSLCQSAAGVSAERDLLNAEREPHKLSTLTEEERAAVEEMARTGWPVEEAKG